MRTRDRRGLGPRLLDHLDARPDGRLAHALAPFSALYIGVGRVHRWLRPFRSLPSTPPSIGVGNLRVGGTGKTPVVADLARRLSDEGLRVAVLTRGYRGGDGADEPGWLSDQGFMVIAGPDRARGHAEAARTGADVVLLDDALQCRDRPGLTLAIVLSADLKRMPRPLPAGPARESARGIERAGAWLVRQQGPAGSLPLTGSQPPRIVIRLVPQLFAGAEGEVLSTEEAPSLGPVLAVSGLARPQSFEGDLERLGCEVHGVWRGPDHWTVSRADLADLEAHARAVGAACLVCPEKNLRRLRSAQPALPLWSLRSSLQWETADPLGATGIRAYLGLHI